MLLKIMGKFIHRIIKEFINLVHEIDFYEEIQSIGFYEYEFLRREIKINNLKPIELIIIKDMEEDREIITGIIKVSALFIILTIFLGLYISKKFYNRFVPALKNLQDITNNINLE